MYDVIKDIQASALSLPLFFARDPVSTNGFAPLLLVGAGTLLPLVYLAGFAFPDKADRLAYAFGVLIGSLFEEGSAEIVSLLPGITQLVVWPQVRLAEAEALAFSILWGTMFFSLYYAIPG